VKRALAFTPFALVAFLMTSCVSGLGQAGPAPHAEDPTATVTATTRTISSVVVVSGDVAPTPHFWISAPVAGAVHFAVGKTSTSSQPTGAVVATVAGTSVVLSAAGSVDSRLVEEGQTVAANTPIADAIYSGFGIAVDVPAAELYRIYAQPSSAKATVTAGPSGLNCTLVPTPPAAAEAVQPNTGSQDDGYRPVACLLPIDAKVVAGLPAKVGVETAHQVNVIALPVAAVSGSSGQGEVTLVDGNARHLTTVKLGISDGAYIEIISGLKSGDKVLAYAPQLG
jgi:macrolide-specific efflux system membrane fusion protein